MIKKVFMSKSGVTLIELLAGLLIMTILAAAATSVIAPTLNAFYRANSFAEVNTLFDTLSSQIMSDLSLARAVSFAPDGSVVITKANSVTTAYSVDGGFLCRDGVKVLDDGFYKSKRIAVEYYNGEDYDGENELNAVDDDPSGATEFIVRIILSEKDGGGDAIRRDYAVKPLVMNQYYEP